MRGFGFIIGIWLSLLAAAAGAGTYSLTDGTSVTGDPTTFEEEGLVLKNANGAYSPVVPWGKFTDAALKQLLADAATPRQKAVVAPMITQFPPANPNPPAIAVNPVATPARPTGHLGLLALFTSPEGWFLFLVFYGANIFAAYEVAAYRNRPARTVCGYAAIPFFGLAGTIYFLATPTLDLPDEPAGPSRKPERPSPKFATAPHSTPAADANYPPEAEAEPEPPAVQLPAPIVYRRGDYSFNRRFFETKFAGFFRIVLGEAEKDLVIQIKAARGEYIGKRITRITPTDLFLQVFKEGVTADEMIPFIEITEVQIIHKDLL